MKRWKDNHPSASSSSSYRPVTADTYALLNDIVDNLQSQSQSQSQVQSQSQSTETAPSRSKTHHRPSSPSIPTTPISAALPSTTTLPSLSTDIPRDTHSHLHLEIQQPTQSRRGTQQGDLLPPNQLLSAFTSDPDPDPDPDPYPGPGPDPDPQLHLSNDPPAQHDTAPDSDLQLEFDIEPITVQQIDIQQPHPDPAPAVEPIQEIEHERGPSTPPPPPPRAPALASASTALPRSRPHAASIAASVAAETAEAVESPMGIEQAQTAEKRAEAVTTAMEKGGLGLVRMASTRKRNRMHFFNSEDGQTLRLGNYCHMPIMMKSDTYCALCGTKKGGWRGHKTKLACEACHVHLCCRVPPKLSKTCWRIWHTEHTLAPRLLKRSVRQPSQNVTTPPSSVATEEQRTSNKTDDSNRPMQNVVMNVNVTVDEGVRGFGGS